jgi:hypothetical protein
MMVCVLALLERGQLSSDSGLYAAEGRPLSRVAAGDERSERALDRLARPRDSAARVCVFIVIDWEGLASSVIRLFAL